MNVLHLLSTCDIGGVEVLCRDYALYSTHHNYFVAIWGTNGIVAKEMAENGATVVELGARKQDAIYIVKQLKAICKQHQIDVVIAHHGSPYFYFFYFWLKHSFCNLKLIAYAHCNSVDMYKKKTFGGNFLRRKIISYGFRHADQVIAISESVKASLYSELNVPTNTIKTIYNGVNITKYITNSITMREKRSAIRIIYVGRLTKEKGVQNILNILNIAGNEIPYCFTIVGDGPYRKELVALAEQLGNRSNIAFKGQQEDVSPFLGNSDIFIHLPDWEEGFGLTVVEAMAAGVICICRRKGGLGEIIEDGVSGFLVDSDGEVLSILEKFYSHPDSMVNIRTAARKRAKQFDIKKFAITLDQAIGEI